MDLHDSLTDTFLYANPTDSPQLWVQRPKAL
jgi:hypothetical protein